MTNTAAGDERQRLTAVRGLAALWLEALSSVAHGPEAILVVLVVLVVLVAAGAAGLRYSLPVTGAIILLHDVPRQHDVPGVRRSPAARRSRRTTFSGSTTFRAYDVPAAAFRHP